MVNTIETAEGVFRKILVAESAVPELEKSVKKLARVAKRLNLFPIPVLTVDWSSKREVKKTYISATRDGAEIVGESRSVCLVPVVDASILMPDTGKVMATGGWTVLGSLSKTDEGLEVNAFRAVNLPLITPYRDRNSMACEHCKAKRNRAKTLILRNNDGHTMQVGRECAHNYVTDIAAALAALEFHDLESSVFSVDDSGEVYEYGFAGARTLRAFDIEDALAEICACIRKDGGFSPSKTWVADRHSEEGGRYETNDHATWRTVRWQMTEIGRISGKDRYDAYCEFDRLADEARQMEATYPGNPAVARAVELALAEVAFKRAEFDRKHNPLYPRAAEDDAAANALIEWISTLEIDAEKDEFLANLKDLVVAGFVSERRLSFLAALPGAKTRWERKQDEVNNPPTTPAPTGRVEVTGEVVSVKHKVNEFTGGDVYKMLVLLSDRNKVYCSVPRGVDPDNAKGMKIRFVARFDRSPDDEHFSFGSRPTLKEVLS
jgi:hypothetical protein